MLSFSKSILPLALMLLTILPASSSILAQDTIKARTGQLELSVNLPGIFVADDKDEIKIEPSKYSGDLIVTRILPEGVNVKKGDSLIEFETGEVDDTIVEAQNEATDANVELKKAQAEYLSAVIDRDANLAHLQTELGHLEREVRASIVKQSMDLSEKEKAIERRMESLADAKIDFETLKQMYEERKIAKPISAEILFDRERRGIKNQELAIDVLEKELGYFKRFDKSKTQLEKELAVDKKEADIKKQKVNLEAAVAEKKGIVDKAQRKMDAAMRKVTGLQHDQTQLRVVSPRDGVLFYGATGSEMPAGVVVFGTMESVRDNLKIGGRVQTHRVLLTVSQMDNLSIKMSVSEHDIQHLKNDLPLTVYPDAFPNESFEGALTSVDQIATKIGFTSVQRRFKVMGKCTDDAPQLRSGMNCRVCIHVGPTEEKVLIPVGCLSTVAGEFVCFVKQGDKAVKRAVELGSSNAEFAEINSGVEAGEEVYLHTPDSSASVK